MSADALRGNREPRPVSWIITALCFIGAQFVIVPFLIFLALASDGALIEAPGGFGAAAALLTLSHGARLTPTTAGRNRSRRAGRAG